MSEEDIIKMLAPFCSFDPYRKNAIGQPYSTPMHTEATDGRIIIRVPRLHSVHFNELAPKKTAELGWRHLTVMEWVDCAVRGIKKTCNRCRGSGWSFPCIECSGDGEVILENEFSEYVCECKSCRGRGMLAGKGEKSIPCETCHGTGFHSDECVKIGKAHILEFHYQLISGLPESQIEASDSYGSDGNYPPICFKFSGGEGLIMPIINR
jgi:hypothetical protein